MKFNNSITCCELCGFALYCGNAYRSTQVKNNVIIMRFKFILIGSSVIPLHFIFWNSIFGASHCRIKISFLVRFVPMRIVAMLILLIYYSNGTRLSHKYIINVTEQKKSVQINISSNSTRATLTNIQIKYQFTI